MAVLGIPVINRPDLLRRCIASIDIPVTLVVVDNSPESFGWDIVPDDAVLVQPAANMGYAASVNHVIQSFPAEPYWLFANADVEFAPGDLSRLVGATESGEWGWVGIRDWRAFGLTAATVERVGLIDENFHPAFCEDADYERRCTLAGVPWGFIEGATSHVRSVSLDDYRADNDRSYPSNVAYYVAKWGGPMRGGETFTTPFDRGGSLADGTAPHLSRLRANAWGVHHRAGS